jgi:formylglycine-generating enzyme required for sulfatase activity
MKKINTILLICLFLQVVCATEAHAGAAATNSRTIVLPKEGMTFRRISPIEYGTNIPAFFLLETEVTNEMYEQFLRSTGAAKKDEELYRQEEELRKKQLAAGSVSWSSRDPAYTIRNVSLLWPNGHPPKGKEKYPVALIRITDADAFCAWLTTLHSELGLFRLPSKQEWMLAAYGAQRKYPWGDNWDIRFPRVSLSKGDLSEPVAVDAPTRDITPEGIKHLWGNVTEYIGPHTHGWDVVFMGASFERYPTNDKGWPFMPRQNFWGFVHRDESRMEDTGFRVLLEPK